MLGGARGDGGGLLSIQPQATQEGNNGSLFCCLVLFGFATTVLPTVKSSSFLLDGVASQIVKNHWLIGAVKNFLKYLALLTHLNDHGFVGRTQVAKTGDFVIGRPATSPDALSSEMETRLMWVTGRKEGSQEGGGCEKPLPQSLLEATVLFIILTVMVAAWTYTPMSMSKTGSLNKMGGLDPHQYPSWAILEFCKMFLLGKTGQWSTGCLYTTSYNYRRINNDLKYFNIKKKYV